MVLIVTKDNEIEDRNKNGKSLHSLFIIVREVCVKMLSPTLIHLCIAVAKTVNRTLGFKKPYLNSGLGKFWTDCQREICETIINTDHYSL